VAIVIMALLAAPPASLAMNNYDDPRVILSYMDRSLDGPQDILRVKTTITTENQLTFQVKTRAGESPTQVADYVLLEVQHERFYRYLLPLDPALGDQVLAYTAEQTTDSPLVAGTTLSQPGSSAFRAGHIPNGVEYSVPLTWLDYGAKIAFDAYTLRGQILPEGFLIEEIYDRAAKGRQERRLVSPIMLLNNLCATRR
jgi:hypothetical protein